MGAHGPLAVTLAGRAARACDSFVPSSCRFVPPRGSGGHGWTRPATSSRRSALPRILRARSCGSAAWWQDAVSSTRRAIVRESIRTLQPLEDCGTLCEVQRSLAEILLQQGSSTRRRPTHSRPSRPWFRKTSARRPRHARPRRSFGPPGRHDEAETLHLESIEILERSECTRSSPSRGGRSFSSSRSASEWGGRRLRGTALELRVGDVPDESAARMA
jgi:hypothetical protein